MRYPVRLIIFLSLACAVQLRAQDKPFPYQNPQLKIETRVQDLLSRMTLEEKLWQLFMTPGDLQEGKEVYRHGVFGLQVGTTAQGSGVAEQLLRHDPSGSAKVAAEKINAIQHYFVEETRLGIPIIAFDEALHGLVREGATAFPQSIGLSATFNVNLMGKVAEAISRETRSRGIRQILSPVVNVATDVRWGRVEETYGEDPFLSAAMGTAFVSAFEKLGVITTPKHFLANHGDGGRDSYPVEFNERRLREVYLPPFKACFQQGGSRSLMISYNSLNGLPCSANDWLLHTLLRDEYGFQGFVISDAGAVGGINDLHRLTPGYAESARFALENGLDVLFQTTPAHFPLFYAPALADQPIAAAAVDSAVARVLRAKFQLGLFEDPYVDPAQAALWNGHASHKELAKEAARESIILLKNAADVLPLAKNLTTLAVIGPDANAARLGGYSGPGIAPVSILEGIREKLGDHVLITVAPGCQREELFAQVVPASHLSHEEKGQIRNGLSAAYWDNPDFAGTARISRIDEKLDFSWTLFSPDPAIPFDWYSVRWKGYLEAPCDGLIRIGLQGTDGFRLYLDDSLLIDHWKKGSYRQTMVPFQFQRGLKYRIKIEYHERGGNARLKFIWDYGVQKQDDIAIAEAVAAARQSQTAVVVVGLIEGEGMDRAFLHLPGRQGELIRAVAATGTPTVVVISGGSAVTMGDWIDQVAGVLDVWYPGQEGGHAVADVLFGDYNPAGRLPITFPLSEGQLPLMYNHKPTGRLDRYYDLPGEPLFPFGYGLSYTTFAYEELQLDKMAIGSGDSLRLSCCITNTGSRAGDEVVQLYKSHLLSPVSQPVIELVAFQRLHLRPGERKQVAFALGASQFRILDKELNSVLEPGPVRLYVGGSSRDLRLRETVQIL